MDHKPLLPTNFGGGLVIPFGMLAVSTVSLPLLAFLFCIIWSLMFNFVSSTSTHCGVHNYLPSISAAVGTFTPQKYVWRCAIALHCAPRYLVSYMYFTIKHQSSLLLVLNLCEITALIGLTFISSTENYPIHAFCFAMFMLSAISHMFLVTYGHFLRPLRFSRVRKYLCWTNVSAGIGAVYFFSRHNSYCEPGIYTLFALCEYIVVISNMTFHFQAYFDFRDIFFQIVSNKIDLLAHRTHLGHSNL